MNLTCFSAQFYFQDIGPASVCGFCRPDCKKAVEGAFQTLSQKTFGPAREGILVDHRFAHLLEQAGKPVQDAILLTAGSICVPNADGPCGAVFGNLFEPSKSAQTVADAAIFLDGQRLSLFLCPGVGAAAFWPENSALFRSLTTEFPAQSVLTKLQRQAQGGLWALDYLPGSCQLDGSCHVFLHKP